MNVSVGLWSISRSSRFSHLPANFCPDLVDLLESLSYLICQENDLNAECLQRVLTGRGVAEKLFKMADSTSTGAKPDSVIESRGKGHRTILVEDLMELLIVLSKPRYESILTFPLDTFEGNKLSDTFNFKGAATTPLFNFHQLGGFKYESIFCNLLTFYLCSFFRHSDEFSVEQVRHLEQVFASYLDHPSPPPSSSSQNHSPPLTLPLPPTPSNKSSSMQRTGNPENEWVSSVSGGVGSQLAGGGEDQQLSQQQQQQQQLQQAQWLTMMEFKRIMPAKNVSPHRMMHPLVARLHTSS